MGVKVFLLLSIFYICGSASENCTCYVGHANDIGEVELQVQTCSSFSPTTPVPSSMMRSTLKSAVPTSKGTTTNKPDATTTNKPNVTTTPKEASTVVMPDATTQQSTQDIGSTDATTVNPGTTKDTSTPQVNSETSTPKASTPAAASASPHNATSKRRKREALPLEPLTTPACCQITIVTNKANKLLFNGNTTGWTANFSCFDNSSVNVCNENKCNDLRFLRSLTHNKFYMPNYCNSTLKVVTTKKPAGFMYEAVDGDETIMSCNKYSWDKCSPLNLTEDVCPEDEFCCCPLTAHSCKDGPPTGSTSSPASVRITKKKPTTQNKSFDWKIVGYIATGALCGIFLTIIVRFIYGKKKKNELRMPNYKYSRLRADYVVEDQEL